MLEIESLIGLTEITYSENESLEVFFQNILLNYISTMNASCGLILLMDENSGSFNVISELNLSYIKESNKIIRANKGVFKELKNHKNAVLLDSIENEVPDLLDQEVSLNFFGDFKAFGKKTVSKIEDAENQTNIKNPKLLLNVALGF